MFSEAPNHNLHEPRTFAPDTMATTARGHGCYLAANKIPCRFADFLGHSRSGDLTKKYVVFLGVISLLSLKKTPRNKGSYDL